MVHFAKNSNFYSIDFLHFFAKLKKSVDKTVHQKKHKGRQTPKIVKSRQSYSNGSLPCHCSFYFLARLLMRYDVACEFVCATRMRRNN